MPNVVTPIPPRNDFARFHDCVNLPPAFPVPGLLCFFFFLYGVACNTSPYLVIVTYLMCINYSFCIATFRLIHRIYFLGLTYITHDRNIHVIGYMAIGMIPLIEIYIRKGYTVQQQKK